MEKSEEKRLFSVAGSCEEFMKLATVSRIHRTMSIRISWIMLKKPPVSPWSLGGGGGEVVLDPGGLQCWSY